VFSVVAGLTKPVRAYRVKITEKILDANNVVIEGDVYDNTSDVNYAFNASFDRVSFTSYTQNDYLVSSTSTATKFLTSKPNFATVNDASVEFLYFLQNKTESTLQLRVRTYDVSKTLLDTYTADVNNLNVYDMYRLNISPKALQASFGDVLSDVAYYVVDLISDGDVRSEARTYIYGKQECHNEYLNLLWENDFGGVDSYQFINPKETINVSNRFTIKRNIGGIFNGLYSDISDSIYNPSEVIIDNTTTGSVSVITDPLSDAQAYWFVSLFKSKHVFLELPNYLLVPVMLQNNSYQIPRLRYVKNALNNITVDFTLAYGVLPSAYGAYDEAGNPDVYESEERSGVFTRNNCGANETPTTVTYTIFPDTFFAATQAEANQLAQDEINNNGQAYANANGMCNPNVNFVVSDVWYYSGNACDGEAVYVNWFEIRRQSDNTLIHRFDNNPTVNGGTGHITGILNGVGYTLTANIRANTLKTNGISATYMTANTVNASWNELGAANVTRSINFVGQTDNNIYVACSSLGSKCG
jgi:hypothetical protein